MTKALMALCFALFAAAFLAAAPAPAQPDTERHYFIYGQDRDVLRGYIRKSRWYFCPPGTYMKGGDCVVMRGHPVFYSPGSRLPHTVYYTALPGHVVAQLAPPPPGAVYVRYYDDVYLIDARTRLVLDALNLSVDLR